jgi:molybdopterin-guanine dinucleotide biosynthesis protein A
LLQRIVRIVGQVAAPQVVVAAPGQALPSLPAGVEVVCDAVEGRGPLQGLAAGLAALDGRADAAYLSSCDVPFLLPQFIARMIYLLGDLSICVPFDGQRYHPLAAVYRVDLVDSVRVLLAGNRLRPIDLFETARTRVAETNELADIDPTLQSLRNLNTPADYEAALREAATL